MYILKQEVYTTMNKNFSSEAESLMVNRFQNVASAPYEAAHYPLYPEHIIILSWNT